MWVRGLGCGCSPPWRERERRGCARGVFGGLERARERVSVSLFFLTADRKDGEWETATRPRLSCAQSSMWALASLRGASRRATNPIVAAALRNSSVRPPPPALPHSRQANVVGGIVRAAQIYRAIQGQQP